MVKEMVNPDIYNAHEHEWSFHTSGGDFGKDVVKTEISNERVMDRYARLSQSAYDYYYKGHDKAVKDLKLHSPEYVMIPKLSDKNSIVTKRGNEVIISYRGTDPFNASDLAADGQIVLGKPMELLGFPVHRFLEAETKYLQVKRMFPEASIVTTGHSLGGAQSQHVSRKYGTQSYVYNSGSSPFDLPTEAAEMISRRGRVKAFHIPYDLISASQYHLDKSSENTLVGGDKRWSAHSLENFFVPKDEEDLGQGNRQRKNLLPISRSLRADDQRTEENKPTCIPGSSKGQCRQRVYNRPLQY